MLLAAGAIATVVAVSGPAPAAADEPGLWCFFDAAGSITAPSVGDLGQTVTVQWNWSSSCYAGLVAFVSGPGFNPSEAVPTSGSRNFTLRADDDTVSWTLYVMDYELDSAQGKSLGSTTITCRRACQIPLPPGVA